DREDAILLSDAHRDAGPRRQLITRELSCILALAKHLSQVRERAHLPENTVADHAAHLRKEAGLHRVEPAGEELGCFLGTRQGTRDNKRELRGALRKRLRHRPSRQRKCVFLPTIGPFGVTANLDHRHGPQTRSAQEEGRLVRGALKTRATCCCYGSSSKALEKISYGGGAVGG